MMDFPLVLGPLLERAETQAKRVEIVWRRADRSIGRSNWGELGSRARTLARGLLALGLRRGDRVATFLHNQPEHLEAYYGIPLAGGVLHPLNFRLHPDELANITRHARDRFLLADESLLPLLAAFRDRAPFERIFVVSAGATPAGFESYESILAPAEPATPLPQLSEHEAAALCYTSGTTGASKGVAYSHRALVLHSFLGAMADSFGVSQGDTIFAIAPMFHVNGWGFPFTAALVGAKLVLAGPQLDPEGLLELMSAECVTITGAVPTLWLAMFEILRREPGRFPLQPGLRAIVGGSAASESLLRAGDACGVRLMHLWGMTETTPQATISALKPHLRHIPQSQQYALRAKQGWAAPFVEARVSDELGRNLPWDGRSLGELQVRGPWVAGRYFDAPDANDRWTADGWFKTGDVASIDEDGLIQIADRLKDLIKSGGEWISSVALENQLMGHPDVKEACVVAVPHPKWGERPLAVIVAREGRAPTPDALCAHLSPHFAKWQIPDAFVFVDQIPRTSVGKFKKSALRARFQTWTWPA